MSESWYDEVVWHDAPSFSAPSRVPAKDAQGNVQRDENGDLVMQRCPHCNGQIFHHVSRRLPDYGYYACPFCDWKSVEHVPRTPTFYLDGVEVQPPQD